MLGSNPVNFGCWSVAKLVMCCVDMQMGIPHQALSPQGYYDGSCGILAVNALGNGSGWRQSKSNWALWAVVGQIFRISSSYPWQV